MGVKGVRAGSVRVGVETLRGRAEEEVTRVIRELGLVVEVGRHDLRARLFLREVS